MTYLVGRDLGEALFNSDFSVHIDDIRFPADTFTIYYRDSQISVGPTVLKWLFVDRVALSPHRSQLRIIFGYVDEDDDWANSDFFFFDYEQATEIKSDELFQMIEDQKVSDLSYRKVADEHRQNSLSVPNFSVTSRYDERQHIQEAYPPKGQWLRARPASVFPLRNMYE